MQVKIAITGPESSGKTTLAKSLNDFYTNSIIVHEFAREYLKKIQRKYNYNDLLEIAKGQRKREIIANTKNSQIIISDTTLQVIKIWSLEKFKKCDDWILQQKENYTHYLLCKPDITWEPDPFRENPLDRDRLFNIYLKDLQGKSFTIISGDQKSRLSVGKKIINGYLNIKKTSKFTSFIRGANKAETIPIESAR